MSQQPKRLSKQNFKSLHQIQSTQEYSPPKSFMHTTHQTARTSIVLPKEKLAQTQRMLRRQSQTKNSIKIQKFESVGISARAQQNQLETIKAIKENQENLIFEQLCHIKHSHQLTVYEIFKKFSDNLQQLIKMKNERYAYSQMIKYAVYNAKIKEFISMFNVRLSSWTPEYLLRTMIQLQIDNLLKLNSESFRKFRLDTQLIDSVIELNRRFEDSIMHLCDDKYLNMSAKIIEQTHILEYQQTLEKEREVKQHMQQHKKYQQMKFLKDLSEKKYKLDLRLLNNDLADKLHFQEERNGKFHMISALTRHISYGIDGVVQTIKYNQAEDN